MGDEKKGKGRKQTRVVDWTGFKPAPSVLSVAPSLNGDRRSLAKLPAHA
jgi:hypothetical protein